MASTRRQKTKGKYLCLTDFFNQAEQCEDAVSAKSSPSSQPSSGELDKYIETDCETESSSQVLAPPQVPQSTKKNNMKRGTMTSPKSPNNDLVSSDDRQSFACETSSPTAGSPVKHRPRLDIDSTEEILVENPITDLLGAFPITDQAVSQAFLKDMMLALRSSIQHSVT